DDGHDSPPPILVPERRRRDRNPLAGDVLQDVDLVRQRSAGKHFEDVQRTLQGRVRALLHERLDVGARQSRHPALPKVAASVYPLPAAGKTPCAGCQPTRRSAASRPGGAEGRADRARSSGGAKEYGGHGPVGTPATPTAWDATGAIRERKPVTSGRGTRNTTEPTTLPPLPEGRSPPCGSPPRPTRAPASARSSGSPGVESLC